MKRKLTATLAAAFFSHAGTALAGEPAAPPAAPDPTSLSMPPLPLAFAEKDRADGDSRFYFHKDGVNYQAAFSDFRLCNGYAASVVLVARPRDYVPLGPEMTNPDTSEDAAPRTVPVYGGLVGALLFDAIVAPDIWNSAMRLCMNYKGYKRYAVSSTAYRAITRGTSTEAMARQAIVASGPAPQGGEVGP